MCAMPSRELDVPQVVRTVVSVRCDSTEQFHHVFTCSLDVERLCASCVDEVSVEFISQLSHVQKILGLSDTMIHWRAHVPDTHALQVAKRVFPVEHMLTFCLAQHALGWCD